MNLVQKGVYEHFKGRRYEVIDQALNSETLEPMVIYKALYESDFPQGTLWVRPLTMFKENVEVKGELIPRFRLISSSEKKN